MTKNATQSSNQNEQVVQMMTAMNARLEALSAEFASFKATSSPERELGSSGHSTSSTPKHVLKLGLECPRFDGTRALDWIFAANRYFDDHQTPEPERLRVVSFYMDGTTLCWFQWMEKNGQQNTWREFQTALEC